MDKSYFNKKYRRLDSDKLWFVGDPHFGHKSIIEYDNRPFKDVVDMNRQLVANWNAVVDDDHLIFILGDFALTKTDAILHILKQLKGRKVGIIGNHDYRGYLRKQHIIDEFEYVRDTMEITVYDQR